MWKIIALSTLISAVAAQGGPQFAGPQVQQEPPAACKPMASVMSACPPPPSIISMLMTMTAPPTSTMSYPAAAESYQASCVCYDDKGKFRPAYISSIVMDCASFILKNGGGQIKDNTQAILDQATYCYSMGDIKNGGGKTAAATATGTSDAAATAPADGGNSTQTGSTLSSPTANSTGSTIQVHGAFIALVAFFSLLISL